jgi:hypothetical protein
VLISSAGDHADEFANPTRLSEVVIDELEELLHGDFGGVGGDALLIGALVGRGETIRE